MKKIGTTIGLILHIVYYILAILSLGDYEYSGQGVGTAFAFWVYAMIVSLLCLFAYIIDAFRSLLKSRKPFYIFRLFAVLVAGVVCVCVGASAGVENAIIWNTCFTLLFAIQAASLFVKEGNTPPMPACLEKENAE